MPRGPKRCAERDRAGAALTLARTLADRPRGRIAIDWSKPSPWAVRLTPEIGPAAALLSVDAVLRVHDGDLEGALLSCRAILHAAAAIGDIPTFAVQQFRIDQRDLVFPLLERVLAQGEPAAAALADLQTRLAEEAKQPLMLMAARGERAALDQLCQAMRDGQVPFSSVFSDNYKEAERQQKEQSAVWRAMYAARITRGRMVLLEKMNRKVEIHKLPPEQLGKLDELTKGLRDESILVERLFGVTNVEVHGWRRSQASLLSAVAALAAERYRQKHGRWPARLADLVPDFLPAVPSDPFDGAPLRYRRQKEGAIVYSVSSDGKDGGGAFETLGVYPHNDDVGFRLWNIDRRRAPK